ncbi:MAG: hypothetical protein GXP06_13800 [Alphaproteobacteria bacterium]|nr:hypothetical protein [Alphaproteobacteria bacterium]
MRKTRFLRADKALFFIVSAIVGILVAEHASAQPTTPELIPLYHWYSPSRGDNFTTADPAWAGQPGDTQSPDYRFVGVLGYILAPTRGSAPPDTVPLYSWYNPQRGDNFLSSNPTWRPRNASDNSRDPNYRLGRLEGYIYNRPLAGTLPLQSHWSPSREDNFAAAHTTWVGEVGKTSNPDYRLYRNEGYIVSPYEVHDFNIRTIANGVAKKFGVGAALVAPRAVGRTGEISGTRPLLVLLAQSPAVQMDRSTDYYEELIFGTDTDDGPNVGSITSYFREMSQGKFTWSRAGVVGPVTVANSIIAPAGVVESSRATLVSAAVRQAAASGFSFRRYDRNGDNTVDQYELSVIVFYAYDLPGANAGQAFTITVNLPGGLTLQANTPYLPESSGIQVIAHELMHALGTGVDNDIYGSGSGGSSLMSASVSADHKPIHLDPWHKMRLGWVSPRLEAISPFIPPSSANLSVPVRNTYQPILFHDFNRPYSSVWQDFEMFLMEYRSAAMGANYDTDVADTGVALWYARMGDPLIPGETNGPFESPPNPPELVMEDQSGCNPSDTTPTSRTWNSGVGQALWIVSALEQCRGLTPYWREEHGRADINWYPRNVNPTSAYQGVADLSPRPGDNVPLGDPSGLRFKIGDDTGSRSSVEVEWSFSDQPFLPRIDKILGGSTRRPGQVVSIVGNFGLEGNKIARLSSTAAQYDLEIVRYGVDEVWVKIPDDVPDGSYRLHLMTRERGLRKGNSVWINVRR